MKPTDVRLLSLFLLERHACCPLLTSPRHPQTLCHCLRVCEREGRTRLNLSLLKYENFFNYFVKEKRRQTDLRSFAMTDTCPEETNCTRRQATQDCCNLGNCKQMSLKTHTHTYTQDQRQTQQMCR